MTVQEIFNTPAIREIEIQAITLIRRYDDTWTRRGMLSYDKIAVSDLMRERKIQLDRMFVMTDEYKQLLAEFNDALAAELLEVRRRAIIMRDAIVKTGLVVHCDNSVITDKHDPDRQDLDDFGNLEITGKCYFRHYPKLHPVQTNREKAIWHILNEEDFCYDKYQNGIIDVFFTLNNSDSEKDTTEYETLYLNDKLDNWNDGFECEKTKDMHLTHAFHHLYERSYFSIFDLLWVRDFGSAVSANLFPLTYAENYDDDDDDDDERNIYDNIYD